MSAETVVAELRTHALRVTKARKTVLGLLDPDRYRSAEELACGIGGTTSLSTVYRTLDSLVSHGLAEATLVGGCGERRYARVASPFDLRFVCSGCGQISRHQSHRLNGVIAEHAKAAGVSVELPVTLSVQCSDCSPLFAY